ncbi:SCO2400 family protein [Streptomyces sp. QTS137]
MDYCSTCRRHLNGALVCPGCGAYAPDIAPSVIGGRAVPGAATSAAPTADFGTTAGTAIRTESQSEPGEEKGGPGPGVDTPDPVSASAFGCAISAPTGRAARRRQLARWKKTQRRALVATAVAFVGGGLTLASMDRGSGDRARAATAPEVSGMGGVDGPADQDDGPAPSVGPPGTQRSQERPSRPAPDDDTHRRSTGTAPAPTTASDARPDDAAGTPTSRGTPSSGGSGSQDGSDSNGSGSAAATRPTIPPADSSGNDDNDSDKSGGSDSQDGSQPAAPPPSTPAPESPGSSGSGSDTGTGTDTDAELCLLVICLG